MTIERKAGRIIVKDARRRELADLKLSLPANKREAVERLIREYRPTNDKHSEK